MSRLFQTLKPVVFLIICVIIVSCDSPRKRPYGYLRLGPLSEFLNSEIDLTQEKLLIRRDTRGMFAMSTMCTYDLTYLVRRNIGEKIVYASDYTSSTYDSAGHVLTGPAKYNLPYYKLAIDSGTYGGPKDTLYAVVGEEVDEGWRLILQ
jgi:hypothetical protein